jgi:hypothetical protein
MNAVEGVVHSVTGKFIALRRREGFQAVLGDPTTRTRDRAFFSRQYIIRYHPFVFFFFCFFLNFRFPFARTSLALTPQRSGISGSTGVEEGQKLLKGAVELALIGSQGTNRVLRSPVVWLARAEPNMNKRGRNWLSRPYLSLPPFSSLF